jgi:putative endonuclease
MPSGTTSKKLHWIYVLLSLKDGKRYIGYTGDINQRLREHKEGKVFSTQYRRPFIPLYI